MWTGSTGSRATGASYAEQYNRARHYGSKQAGWTSVDPLWPLLPPFNGTFVINSQAMAMAPSHGNYAEKGGLTITC